MSHLSAIGVIRNIMSRSLARTKAQVEQVARDRGNLAVFYPKPDELLLDIDEPYPTAVIRMGASLQPENNRIVSEGLGYNGIFIMSTLYTLSPGGNLHVYVKISKYIGDLERVVIQAVLKSDPLREVLNMLRVSQEDGNYSMALFETDEMAKLVVKWRRDYLLTSMKQRIRYAKLCGIIDAAYSPGIK